jgi:hypothetical protein
VSTLKRCSPFVNGTAFGGMMIEAVPGSRRFGPEFAGYGPYYESDAVDAEIERLTRDYDARGVLVLAQRAELERVRDLLRRSWFKSAHMEPGLQDEVLAYFEEGK